MGGGGDDGAHKVFVGGLPQEATNDTLTEYFGKFGTITDVVVMTDRETGRSRGFGFVSFDNNDSVDQVMGMHTEHQIMSKWIDCKRASKEGTKGAVVKGKDKGKGGGKGMMGGCGGGMGGGMGGGYGGGYGAPAQAYGGYGGYGGGAYGAGGCGYPQQGAYGGGYGGYGGGAADYGKGGMAMGKGGCGKGYSPY
mmetsp:Transcript_74258/g.131319  ORF Transcript_74258/g.131319 Transcript_74258/m.131319 type:complete len:194 (+) Transcript_74258:48-629(+)